METVLSLFADEVLTFIDAGANLGYWSIFASRNSRWEVYAIEPCQETYKKLCVNVGINATDVTLLHNAVSDVSHTEVCLETPNGLHAGTP